MVKNLSPLDILLVIKLNIKPTPVPNIKISFGITKLSKSIREIAIIIDVNMTNPIKFTK